MGFQSILESGIIPGGKEAKVRHAFFSDSFESF